MPHSPAGVVVGDEASAAAAQCVAEEGAWQWVRVCLGGGAVLVRPDGHVACMLPMPLCPPEAGDGGVAGDRGGVGMGVGDGDGDRDQRLLDDEAASHLRAVLVQLGFSCPEDLPAHP